MLDKKTSSITQENTTLIEKFRMKKVKREEKKYRKEAWFFVCGKYSGKYAVADP